MDPIIHTQPFASERPTRFVAISSFHPTPGKLAVHGLLPSRSHGVNTVNQNPETTGPGIVVLSPSLQVLYINRCAMARLNQLASTAQSLGAERAVTAPLHQHCRDMLELMQVRLGSNNWEQFEHNRVIGDSSHTSFLNGFGLPDRRGLSHSRIVLLLTPQTPDLPPAVYSPQYEAGPSLDGPRGSREPIQPA
jgi:hypothetical protein